MKEVYTNTPISQLEQSDFVETKGIKKILQTENVIQISLDVEKIISLFKKKFLQKIHLNEKYSELFISIAESNLQEYECEIIDKLQWICTFKYRQLESKIFLEEITKKPRSKIEKISFQK